MAMPLFSPFLAENDSSSAFITKLPFSLPSNIAESSVATAAAAYECMVVSTHLSSVKLVCSLPTRCLVRKASMIVRIRTAHIINTAAIVLLEGGLPLADVSHETSNSARSNRPDRSVSNMANMNRQQSFEKLTPP